MIHPNYALAYAAVRSPGRFVLVVLFLALVYFGVKRVVVSQYFLQSRFSQVGWRSIRYYDRLVKGNETHRIKHEGEGS